MKKIQKISLSQLNLDTLAKKQQQLIFGGNACKCGSCGASATAFDNQMFNFDGDITGTGDNDPVCRCSDGFDAALTPMAADPVF